MLSQLNVKNFAIAEQVSVEFDSGMTVLSGETGAGKSIILDALGLTLGDRADTSMVRHGSDKAEISAVFDLSTLPAAENWLKARDLEADQQCILRRVITAEGRSRGYINGQPCSLQHLKEIGEQLIDIHSQHEHQSLLKKDNHRDILDTFAGNETLSKDVAQQYKAWAKSAQRLEQLASNQDEMQARLQLLSFQIEELEQLGLSEGELEEMEQEQSQLGNAEQILAQAHTAHTLCAGEDSNASQLLSHALQSLQSLNSPPEALREAITLLNEAQIQVSEAGDSIRHFIDGFELDPERLSYLEERLSLCYQLARKHRCEPDALPEKLRTLQEEYDSYTCGDQNLEQLEQEVSQLKQAYLSTASKQRQKRQTAAKQLEKEIAEQLALMDMKSVKLYVDFNPLDERAVNAHGLDNIEFLISTNAGQPPKSLGKVASGGELSRISLAIQVVIAQHSTISTLVFDEVDVGIGGATAEIVGRLLRNLGQSGQVICVTHLPQVASQGHQHHFISKREDKGVVKSSIRKLNSNERTEEIARMLGGVNITESTLAHAQEMLDVSA